MKIWAVGDPEPAEPQVMVSDTAYSLGTLGFAAYRWHTAPSGEFSARFDDIYFTVIPEPSTLVMLAMGAIAIMVGSRIPSVRVRCNPDRQTS